jgi:MIP family channel proteins
MAAKALSNRLVAEFVGTLFFVFLGAGSVVAAHAFALSSGLALVVIAIANGLGLALAVSATMGISGGFLNPAVTIGALVANKIKGYEAVAYIIVEVLGAALGAALLFEFFPLAVGQAVSWGTPAVASSINVGQAVFIEAVMTFFLVFAVFGTAIDKNAPKIGGFGIGLTVFLCALIGGPLTGAAMNPARALGPALVSLSFSNWYVYWMGPIIGGMAAAYVYSRYISGMK